MIFAIVSSFLSRSSHQTGTLAVVLLDERAAGKCDRVFDRIFKFPDIAGKSYSISTCLASFAIPVMFLSGAFPYAF